MLFQVGNGTFGLIFTLVYNELMLGDNCSVGKATVWDFGGGVELLNVRFWWWSWIVVFYVICWIEWCGTFKRVAFRESCEYACLCWGVAVNSYKVIFDHSFPHLLTYFVFGFRLFICSNQLCLCCFSTAHFVTNCPLHCTGSWIGQKISKYKLFNHCRDV